MPTTCSRRHRARGAMWDLSTEVQHELVRGVSLTGGWYRNGHSTSEPPEPAGDAWDFTLTASRAVRCALPGVAATRLSACTTSPHRGFGQARTCDASLALLWRRRRLYVREPTNDCGAAPGPAPTTCGRSDFFSVTVATRLRRIQLGGGVDRAHRSTTAASWSTAAATAELPSDQPFSSQTQIKMYGNYPLPAGAAYGTLQTCRGPPSRRTITHQRPDGASLGATWRRAGPRPCVTAFRRRAVYTPSHGSSHGLRHSTCGITKPSAWVHGASALNAPLQCAECQQHPGGQ